MENQWPVLAHGLMKSNQIHYTKQYSPWHYVNMPLDKEYADIQKKTLKGDIVIALKDSALEF